MGSLMHYEIAIAGGDIVNFYGNGYYYDHAEDTWRFTGENGGSELVVSGREFRWMKSGPATVAQAAQSE